MTERTPKNLEEYLYQLRQALAGEDPALIQDALYDAEEYLRAELAANAHRPQSEVIAEIVQTYGAPEEVAEVYRRTEATVQKALNTPRPTANGERGVLARFFGVLADPRAYSSLFYMLLALATGIFYFTWTVTGVSMSAGFMVLIVGIPFALLFLGTVRLLSLLEGRLVEVMLGVRMPRRPVYRAKDDNVLKRIGQFLVDPRTWSTLLYMLAMLPLGIIYFVIAVTGLSLVLSFLFAPIWTLFDTHLIWFGGGMVVVHWWQALLLSVGPGRADAHRPRYRLFARPAGQAAASQGRGRFLTPIATGATA